MKLVSQFKEKFFNFLITSSHLHKLQVENCDSNSRLVVDEDDNGKFRLERVLMKYHLTIMNAQWKVHFSRKHNSDSFGYTEYEFPL